MKSMFEKWNRISLVVRIIFGIIIGTLLALILPKQLSAIALLGDLFVEMLKAVAPILVFVLVLNAISSHRGGSAKGIRNVLILYGVSTFLAGFIAVLVSYIFPTKLILQTGTDEIAPPSGVGEVLQTLLFNIATNPVTALMEGNFLGVLAWAVILGFALKKANDSTKIFISNVSDAITTVVQWVISFAPIGILGIVYSTIVDTGFASFKGYGQLIAVLVGTMVFIALVVNPLIVFIATGRNPFPLVFTCLKESGITAFFTRSSAANIPVNMALAEKLNLNKDTYAVSIPIGATINMAGAAVTISTLAMAAAYTLNIEVDFLTAVILMVLSAVSAAGASGVAGGSLLLIPLACSLLGISDDIAMQVVAIGFIISVVQDSFETGLNSSSDVVFTATAEYALNRK